MAANIVVDVSDSGKVEMVLNGCPLECLSGLFNGFLFVAKDIKLPASRALALLDYACRELEE